MRALATVLALLLCVSVVSAGWVNQPVPTTLQPPGSANEDPAGTWTVEGAGADIWGNSDQFHYLFWDEPLGDTFAISCHVVSFSGSPNAWAKAGLMARVAPAAGLPFAGPETYAFCHVTNANGTCLQYRDGEGAAAAWSGGTTGRIWVGPNDVWIMLVRDGPAFSAYVSEHPPIWRKIDEYTFTNLMDEDMYVGLAVTSHQSGTLATAVFDNINLQDPGMAPDEPSDFTCVIDGESVKLQWTNNANYEELRLFRSDSQGVYTQLDPGPQKTDESFTDNPGLGIWTYHLVAFVGGSPCAAQSCTVNVGNVGLTDANGFILSWLLLGPYQQAGGAAPGQGEIMRDYLADIDGEINEYEWLPKPADEVETDFLGNAASTGYMGGFFNAGNAVPTVQIHTDTDDTIDLNAIASPGDNDNVMAYAFVYILNPGDPIEGAVELASDDSIQVSLGMCPVFVHNGSRGYGGAGTIQDSFPVTIPSGATRLMVKVFEGRGGWGFRLRLVDGEGTPITSTSDHGIKFVLDPERIGLTELPQKGCTIAVITIDPGTPACGPAPLEVTFDGLASFSRLAIDEYSWDFGDGSPVETGDVVTHTFEEPGMYTVTLTVRDENGDEASATARVNVIQLEEEFECTPPASEPDAELIWAFAFGADGTTCETYNVPGEMYTKVSQSALGPGGLAYNPDRGWGYEVTRPGDNSRNGYGRFGPFDDSENNRGKFTSGCPEELYDQFIGAKNFASPCFEPPCTAVPGTSSREGIHFRIDVPNGLYRFVGAFGDSDNVHAHTIIVEDGGEGEEINMDRAVVLVLDFDQAQWCQGETEPAERGEGVYARVGFNCRIPPLGDGIPPDPRFVNMDENGLPTFDPPNSPTLEVTSGYIRLHQLQGASNDGPGGPRDPNGGDAVIFEVWKVEPSVAKPQFVRGDANDDGALNIADAISILGYLFGGQAAPGCLDTADTNDDSAVNVADAISLLGHLFAGTGPLPAPFPECGEDPTDTDPMTECDYKHCP